MLRMSSEDFLIQYTNASPTRKAKIPSSVNKHRNKHCKWSGLWRGVHVTLYFDSRKERDRSIDLIRLEQAGQIKDLEFQVRFLLLPKHKGERAVHYICDALYFEFELNKPVVEDTKGEYTKKLPAYVLKRKIMKILYPEYEFREY